IDTSQWYAEASFRETDLERIRRGERATVYVMISPGVHLRGVVESITSAAAGPENLAISGAQPVEQEVHWARLSPRVPVRIALEQPREELMRIGASAVAVVYHERDIDRP